MKIKANEKLSKFSSAGMPCDSVTFGKLQDGESVDVTSEVGSELIAMGLASEVKSKKVTKENK